MSIVKWWTIYWQTADGISGSTAMLGESRAEIEAFFEKMLAPRGYRLLSVKN